MSKNAVPESLNEEYYQISSDILESFSKYRPPLDIFRFKEDVARIETYYRAGGRLSKEQVEELAELTREGLIFVSRRDHPVYVKHISYQLDLVLVDKNLKEREIADIFIQALTMRLENFMEQPVRALLERLREDVMVLCEYVWNDVHRIRALTRRLHTEHTLAHHSVNCGVMGTALFIRLYADDFNRGAMQRKLFENAVMGLFLHDLGMSKIPVFLRDKTQALSRDEQSKLLSHPGTGYEMLGKLDLKDRPVEQCVMEHHERLDGSGYPQKLKGKDISPLGRLCAVVDSYCAMVTNRPYAPAKEPAQAANELAEDAKHYDSRIARLLQSLIVTGK
ncbi:HD-GYP domain-containing protein [Desulfohalovibrio reitneri]|uniref:HD-GYP domain-containing protein n=1 Tax=Desulfohalovibrio reitneri TaxID=1307759 RepID=UPI0004A6DD66|nr:HD domain-containing phosphohydrolase [Desulfohalovibrio reitneri]